MWRLVWCHVVQWIGRPAFWENWLSPFWENWLSPFSGYLPTKLHSIAFWQTWIFTFSTVWHSWVSHDLVSLSAVESTIRRPTASPPQWSRKCSRCWSMPANTCTQTTWLSLWPTQTRNRNCVKVMVVGVTYEITSSALIWPAWEGSIRWVRLGEHQVMICHQSSSSGIYDTRRTVGAAVALCEYWVWCWLQHKWASVACMAVRATVIVEVVGISVPCLLMLAVVVGIMTYSARQVT